MQETRLIGLGDVARMLGVSVKTVTRMDRAGLIPAPVHPAGGRALRWDRRELSVWLNRRDHRGELLTRSEWLTVRDSALAA